MMDLLSCNILEKDSNNDVLWTWTYPSITSSQKAVIKRKCSFNLMHPFLYGRYNDEWFYINCTQVFDSDCLPGVRQFALVLWTKDLNPEKYETLCRILSKTYCKTGNPAMLLKLILSVITRGACTTEENGTYYTNDFERSSLQNNTMVRELIKLFGLQTILIYTALLLKKRLVVYHHNLPQLLKWMRTFPALTCHRPLECDLFPWLDLHDDELNQITNRTSYTVGCGDSHILSKVELYDVLVNLPAQEITIAPQIKESLTMTKAHKEIALFLVQLAEQETITEIQIIREIADKTQELLSHLRSISAGDTNGGKDVLSVECLRRKNFSSAVENFLLQLAIAENLLA